MNTVTSSGLGFLTTWAPQQYILNHPVGSLFLIILILAGVIHYGRQRDGFSHMEEMEAWLSHLDAGYQCESCSCAVSSPHWHYNYAHPFTGFVGLSVATNQPPLLTWVAISRLLLSSLRFGLVPMGWSRCWGMDLRLKERTRLWGRSFGRSLMHVMAKRGRNWGGMRKSWKGSFRRLGMMTERRGESWKHSWSGLSDCKPS